MDNEKETIQVCYAMVDKDGTYSKLVGTSICSLLENTRARVVVHLLYDGEISAANREKFHQLEERYGQEIRFYRVPEVVPELWQQGMELCREGLSVPYYAGANMFRLAIPEILSEESRAIYLDADTIVNLDIASLWREEIGEGGLAAVADLDVLRHFGMSGRILPEKPFLITECHASAETVFNSGIMLLDLQRLRGREEHLLLECLRFIKAHEGDVGVFDNDALMALFANTYTHLPWYYDIRLEFDQQFGTGKIVPGIYHYIGKNYGLNPQDLRYRLFLAYWAMSPWFTYEVPWRCYRTTVDLMQELARNRLSEVRRICNLCCRKQRVLVGLPGDEARLRADFELGEQEPFLPLTPGGALSLPYDTATHAYIFFWPNYADVKDLMEKAGKKEYEDFADGTRLLEGQTRDLEPYEFLVLLNI